MPILNTVCGVYNLPYHSGCEQLAHNLHYLLPLMLLSLLLLYLVVFLLLLQQIGLMSMVFNQFLGRCGELFRLSQM